MRLINYIVGPTYITWWSGDTGAAAVANDIPVITNTNVGQIFVRFGQ